MTEREIVMANFAELQQCHVEPATERPKESGSIVAFSPSETVRREFGSWPGVRVETVQALKLSPFEYRFRAPCHLLIAAELAERDGGETFVEGLPRSTQRIFTRKLTFVPAGHDFRGSQQPRALTRIACFYIDPDGPLADPALRFSEIEFRPRLFFHDRDLWETAIKFKFQIERRGLMHRQYGEALSILLAHELVRFNGNARRGGGPFDRGGLAGWQQRRVTEYIEEHLAEDIGLATLAELAQLSPYHFCRSFKRSFGIPPHRYHAVRRIERAKLLLANRDMSITAIAMALGFSETSTFTTAFHRLAGQRPSSYRHQLN